MSDKGSTKSCLELQSLLGSFISGLDSPLPNDVQEAVNSLMGCQTAGLSPSLFYEVVEQSAVAISITDSKANILYANPAFSRVTGYSTTEVVGKNESMLSDHNTPSIVYETMWGRLLQQKPWTGMLINRKKGGERYLADLTIAPVVGSDGEVSHYLGLHRDVTEQQRLEQANKNQKALIESVVNSATVAIVVLDEIENVVMDNLTYKAYASEMGKATKEDELAIDLLDKIKQNLGEEYTALARRSGSFSDQVISFTSEHNLSARWFNCSGSWFSETDASADNFFESKKHHYLLLVVNDITKIKRQEDEIRVNTMRALLAEEEMNQGIRETLLGAMYQMQEPSNLIQAASETLSRRIKSIESGETVLSVLRQARDSSMNAIETLQRCLPESVNTEPSSMLNINDILRDMLSIATKRMLSLGITVIWEPEARLPLTYGQNKRLHSLAKNLIDNAIDAIESGPRQSSRELYVSTKLHGEVVRIVIQDSGHGIPAELRSKVFEPFFTTRHQAGKASGMGLTIVQDVITDHLGTITIDPEYKSGCRIVVELPVRQDEDWGV